MLRGSHTGEQAGPILVLDPNPEDRQFAEQVLRAEGLCVKVASNGGEALAVADRRRPVAVVCDLSLPDVDAVTVVQELRQVCGPSLPVVVVSDGDRAAERARTLGALSFLEKPLDPEHLLLAVLRGLHGCQR